MIFRTALAQYEAGQTSAAGPSLTHLGDLYPANPQVQGAAGMCLLETGQTAKAVPYLERSVKLLPQNTALRRNLALAYLQLDRAPQALPHLRQLTARDASDFDSWFALGQALSASAQPALAAEAYEHAAALQTSSAPPSALLYDWASSLESSGQPAKAIDVLARLPVPGTDASVLALRAEAEERTGAYELAVADYRRAAEMDGSEANLIAYGEELLRHLAFAPAAEIFTYGTHKFPASRQLGRDLGIAWFGGNDFDKAAGVFGTLLAQTPDDATLAELLGRSCDALPPQNASDVCHQLPVFAQAHPGNASAALYAAIALLQGPPDEAVYTQAEALLRSALKADPARAQSWQELAVLQQARHQWAESASSLEHALALKPDYPEAHYRLSRAYQHLGRTTEAQTQIELQRTSADAAKAAETQRLQGVLVFLTAPH